MIFGDGFDNNGSGDGIAGSPTRTQNASIEYSRTINSRIVWTNHFSLDRVHEHATSGIPTISSFNSTLPSGVQIVANLSAGERIGSHARNLHVLRRANFPLD